MVAQKDHIGTWDNWSEVYDGVHGDGNAELAAAFLDQLSPQGRFLELGIGTGRVALALARRCRGVDGIDFSPGMIAKLEEKKGALDVQATLGDMKEFVVDKPYSCIYMAFSTFYSLLSQADQLSCLRSCRDALAPGGKLVVECALMDPTLLRPARQMTVRDVSSGSVGIMASDIDFVTQQASYLELELGNGRITTMPVPQRFCWPAEFDLMVELVGLTELQRYGGYEGQDFNRRAERFVTVLSAGAR